MVLFSSTSAPIVEIFLKFYTCNTKHIC